MTTPDPLRNDFETALAEYFSELEAGRSIGEDAMVTRYPSCAAELRKFFDDLEYVNSALAIPRSSSSTAAQLFSVPARPDVSTGRNGSACHETITSLAGFRILEELGSGGQGIVYKAQQAGTNRPVALKMLREGLFASTRDRRRFQSEVELASRLKHPNVVTIYECGQDSGRDYYAMEYIDGDPLDVYLSKHSLDVPGTLRLFLELGEAIGYAHQNGVIHRDLKPSNVMVDRSETVRVLDFGLAKPVATDASTVVPGVTQAGDFAGTWHYASPEQVERDPSRVDVRTDVYSLGVLLFEMLTDCLPYPVRDESREAIARHILHTPPARPSTIRREIDDDLDTIVLTALQKEPDRRYVSAAALVEDVRRYMAGDAIEAKRDSFWYVVRKTIRPYRWRFAAAASALAALLAFAVTISILYSRALAAQATVTARTRIVRESQNYVAKKLGELNWMSNRLAELAAVYPDLPEIHALGKESCPDLQPIVAIVNKDAPPDIFQAIGDRTSPGHMLACKWLSEHEAELAGLQDSVRSKRLLFAVDTTSASDLAIDQHPRFVLEAQRLAEVFAARALLKAGDGDLQGALDSLDAARALAVSLGDGPLLFHKTSAVAVRSRTYDVMLVILTESCTDEGAADACMAWVKRDPPLPAYRLAMAAERQRISQLFEGACFATAAQGIGYVDSESLAALVGGFDNRTSEANDVSRKEKTRVSPADALALIDTYVIEVEHWDGLDARSLAERATALQSSIERGPAWPLVEIVLPRCRGGFRLRGHAMAKRSAALVAACLVRDRAFSGRWANTLEDLAHSGCRAHTADPYTGQPFGYRLVQGAPLLYSFNEDAEDNRGRPGDWGTAGTDVVLFPLGHDRPATLPDLDVPRP